MLWAKNRQCNEEFIILRCLFIGINWFINFVQSVSRLHNDARIILTRYTFKKKNSKFHSTIELTVHNMKFIAYLYLYIYLHIIWMYYIVHCTSYIVPYCYHRVYDEQFKISNIVNAYSVSSIFVVANECHPNG